MGWAHSEFILEFGLDTCTAPPLGCPLPSPSGTPVRHSPVLNKRVAGRASQGCGEKVRKSHASSAARFSSAQSYLWYIPTTPTRLPLRWFDTTSVTSRRTPRRCSPVASAGAGHAATSRKHQMRCRAMSWLSTQSRKRVPCSPGKTMPASRAGVRPVDFR